MSNIKEAEEQTGYQSCKYPVLRKDGPAAAKAK